MRKFSVKMRTRKSGFTTYAAASPASYRLLSGAVLNVFSEAIQN